MATPNIINSTAIYGKTSFLAPSVATAVVLLQNLANSGQLLKINSVTACNIDGTNAINASVALYTNGAVAPNSAPSGGTAYNLASTISVPANASLIIVDKSSTIYIEENTSLVVTSGAPNKITFVVGYEIIM